MTDHGGEGDTTAEPGAAAAEVLTVLRARARSEGDRVVYTFLRDGERDAISMTFGELWAKACGVAAALRDADLEGERALLLYPPGLDYAVALFGCFLAGVIAVPEGPPDPRRPERSMPRIRAVTADARARAVLTVEALLGAREVMPAEVAGALWMATDGLPAAADAEQAPPPPDALAYLQYTSGSTADPKGVMLTHRNLAENCRAICDTYGPTPESVMVSWVPAFHDLGLVYGVTMPVWAGFRCVSLAAADYARRPARWLQAISHFRGTHSIAPDTAYAIAALKTRPEDLSSLDLSSWEMALNGAEPVRESTERAFVERFGPVGFRAEAFSHSWGLSEATAKLTGERAGARMQFLELDAQALAAHRVRVADAETAHRLTLASCGTPAAGITLRIVDPDTRQPARADEVGEVWVRGPSVGLGYWDAAEASAATFGAATADGDGPWMRTGDRGFLHDGRLFIAGRIKEILIIRGQNHYPHDLEASVAGRHPALRTGGAVTFSVEHPTGEQVVVVAEVRPDRVDDPGAVYRAIRAGLAEHGLRPARIALVPPGAVPRTTSAKLQRTRTRQLLLDDALPALHDWSEGALERPAEVEPAPTVPAQVVQAVIAETLGLRPDEVPLGRAVAELGVDSPMMAELAQRLEGRLGRPVPTSMLFDHPSPAALAEALGGGAQVSPSAPRQVTSGGEADAVAIVAMACRLPGGVDGPEALWRVLEEGVDATCPVPTDRGWPDGLHDDDPDGIGWGIARTGGYLDCVADFDAARFRVSPREALAMDPQQRLLLELTWEVFERAGLDPTAQRGAPIGTWIGVCQTDYPDVIGRAERSGDGMWLMGSSPSVASGRLAYTFGLVGPAITLDTACSSSLVALKQAAEAVRSGACALALAGGATVHATPNANLSFSRMRALSPTGRSRAFSTDADGAGWAEGAGLILVARLDEARRRGLPVLALLRGAAVNQDGPSQGLTAPNGPSQVRVIQQALSAARLEPHQVGLVEAHGTGTQIGDRIELGALLQAYGARGAAGPVHLGSIKSNLGHTQAAAGVAGVMKVVLAMRHGVVPPTLHVTQPTPPLDVDGPLRLARALTPWPPGEQPRRAGVSSFGISGTNAHVILEGVPEAPAGAPTERALCPVLLSAPDPETLRAQAERWRSWLAGSPAPPPLEDIAWESAGRPAERYRAAVSALDHAELDAALRALAAGEDHEALELGEAGPLDAVVFVVPGQGGQWPAMGRALLAEVPAFAAAFAAVEEALAPELDWSLRAVLNGDPGAPSLEQIDVVQCSLFAMGVALAETWRSLGLQPDRVIGNSQGEVAAAVIAGHLSLEDGARVIARRSRLMAESSQPGALVVVGAPVTEIEQRLAEGEWGPGLSLAVVNTAQSAVLSGDVEAAERLLARFEAEGRWARRVKARYASHSAHMDPLLPALRERLADIRPRSGPVELISTVTGAPIDGARLDADYWCRNLREPVRLDRALAALQGASPVFIECSPHAVLAMPLSEAVGGENRAVPSWSRDAEDVRPLMQALGRLFVVGHALDRSRLTGERPLAGLPPSVFRRRRYWPNVSPARPRSASTAPPPDTRGTPQMTPPRPDNLESTLSEVVGRVTGLEPSAVEPDAGLMALGVDSVMVMQIKKAIRQRFQVEVPNMLFFEAETSVRRLAEVVREARPDVAPEPIPEAPAPSAPALAQPHPAAAPQALPPLDASAAGALAQVMQQQLAALTELSRQQLAALQRLGVSSDGAPGAAAPLPAPRAAAPQPAPRAAAPTPRARPRPGADRPVFVPYRGIQRTDVGDPKEHLEDVVARYTAATPTSKARTDADRYVFANNRNIAGFTPATKEMTYQIIADRAKGAYIWDLDGNRFIDLTMGFGSCILGHDSPLLGDAVREQMGRSWAVGPIADPAASVARRVSELTGLERVAFYNSGTEAVMVAVRLARTATRRPKLVIFEGSYHGMFEAVLARAPQEAGHSASPMAPGVPESMVADTIVLPYNDPAALEAIEAQGHTIAAVLVETVQSRRPEVQPRNFLHALRAVTKKVGAALIFDEVVTGFRTGPDGAQGYFGVKADIATYGKVAGGGMPAGIVAGSSQFLDGVDGGMWRYGDASIPEKTNTFAAGTFCSHPLAMAASRALLDHLAAEGPMFQVRLDARTRALCVRLNQVFAEARLPIHVVQFGSLFRYVVPRPYELIYYRLIAEGIYIWEGRNCFLSTAHSDEDLDEVVAATARTAAWLAEAVAPTAGPVSPNFGLLRMPATAAQRAMYARCQRPQGERGFHAPTVQRVRGSFRVGGLADALSTLVHRHLALRTCFLSDSEGTLWQWVHPVGDWGFETTTFDGEPEELSAWIESFTDHICRPFDLTRPELVRCGVAKLGDADHLVVLDIHHLITDGMSMDVLVDELWALYAREAPPLPETDYPDFVAWEKAYLEGPDYARDAQFWAGKAGSPMRFPSDHVEETRSFDGAFYPFELPSGPALRASARANGVTVNTLMVAIFRVFCKAVTGQPEVCFGSPTSGRPDARFDGVVGLFIGTLIHRARLEDEQSFSEVLVETRSDILAMLEAQHHPFEQTAALMGATPASSPFEVGFSFESSAQRGARTIGEGDDALELTVYELPPQGLSMDLVLEVLDDGGTFHLRFAYNPQRFEAGTVTRWIALFQALSERLVAAPEEKLGDVIRGVVGGA